mgnify:CR=1 FL=1
MQLPADPFILLSFVNMKLRDEYSSFEDFCAAAGVETGELKERLAAAGFEYDAAAGRFR